MTRCSYAFCRKWIWPWQRAGFLTVWNHTDSITTSGHRQVWWHRDCWIRAGKYPL